MRGSIILACFLALTEASVQIDRRQGCNHDNCLRAFIRSSAAASSFCATYTQESLPLPTWAGGCNGDLIRVSSACHCLAPASTSSSVPSTTASVSLSTQTSISTTSISSSVPTTSASLSLSTETTTSTTSSVSSSITTSSSTTTSGSTPCTCTAYSQIAPAVASCTDITLQDIAVPSNSTVNLSGLKPNSKVTFVGLMTFGFTNSSTFNSMLFGGSNVTFTAAPGAVIDGNGQLYWDGLGSNGGVPKPDHFIVVSKLTAGSTVNNLHIRNWPAHLFSISGCSNISLTDNYLDNTAGDAPNDRSNGLPAAHNSDGFDISTSSNVFISRNVVLNQDDCVAITSGNNMTVSDMYCSGGHGLSIGSVGGKSNNNVTNILFTNSSILNSQNGARIKTNFNTTGFIANITYSNILLSNISIYGIDVQQDYLNGGPTGIPSNGVIIQNILFQNVTGTAASSATDYYVLCGNGSCSGLQFSDVNIVGGGSPNVCNVNAAECPS